VHHIAENYMDNITIADLSAACHLSASHFRRVFKQILGHSPLDYVHMVRIDRACVLLYNHDHSVTEIAHQVGYVSQSSFLRQFHRIRGTSPNQWRMRMRSEENPMVTAYFNSLPPSNFQFFPMELRSSPHD
jgi:AraC-like DNA-binding protein